MTDFRVLCAELVDAIFTPNTYNWEDSLYEVADRARALLAQPVAEGLTDQELLRCAKIATPCYDLKMWERELRIMRAAIAADRARFGRPTPQPPADGEVAELVAWLLREADYQEITVKRATCADRIRRAACLLEHPTPQPPAELAEMVKRLHEINSPTPQPVAVSERWPEFSDCNPFEAVWAFNPVLDHWKLTKINQSIHTHWLPHWALPVPTLTNNTREEN